MRKPLSRRSRLTCELAEAHAIVGEAAEQLAGAVAIDKLWRVRKQDEVGEEEPQEIHLVVAAGAGGSRGRCVLRAHGSSLTDDPARLRIALARA